MDSRFPSRGWDVGKIIRKINEFYGFFIIFLRMDLISSACHAATATGSPFRYQNPRQRKRLPALATSAHLLNCAAEHREVEHPHKGAPPQPLRWTASKCNNERPRYSQVCCERLQHVETTLHTSFQAAISARAENTANFAV